MEKTKIQIIKDVLKDGRLSKTEICRQTGIHYYLLDTYLNVLEKNKIVKKETNKKRTYVYYELNTQTKEGRSKTV